LLRKRIKVHLKTRRPLKRHDRSFGELQFEAALPEDFTIL